MPSSTMTVPLTISPRTQGKAIHRDGVVPVFYNKNLLQTLSFLFTEIKNKFIDCYQQVCGHGICVNAIMKSIAELKLIQNKIDKNSAQPHDNIELIKILKNLHIMLKKTSNYVLQCPQITEEYNLHGNSFLNISDQVSFYIKGTCDYKRIITVDMSKQERQEMGTFLRYNTVEPNIKGIILGAPSKQGERDKIKINVNPNVYSAWTHICLIVGKTLAKYFGTTQKANEASINLQIYDFIHETSKAKAMKKIVSLTGELAKVTSRRDKITLSYEGNETVVSLKLDKQVHGHERLRRLKRLTLYAHQHENLDQKLKRSIIQNV